MLSNAVQSTPAANNQSATPLALAKLAVLQVFQRIDLQMLEYLDINRVALVDFYKTNHKPDPNYLTNETNKQAVEYATTTMLSYLKPATCLYSKSKDDTSHGNNVKAQMAALIKANLTTQATTAVHEAIEAANLPKDDKTLRDAVTSIVTDLTNKPKQQTKAKSKTAKKSATSPPTKAVKGHHTKAKHPTPQPHPKAKGTRKPKPAGTPRKGTQNNKPTSPKDQPNKTNKVKFKGILKNKGKHNGGANKETNKKTKTKHGKPNPPRQKKDK
jgi:DNA primase